MDLHVQLEGTGDRAERIYRQLRDAIQDGRLRPGERVPSTRDLARQLDVARGTVAVAYESLTAEGYLLARAGSGTYVARLRAEPAAPTSRSRRSARPTALRIREPWRGAVDPMWHAPAPVAYDFSVGKPDPSLFPLEQWRRLMGLELRRDASSWAGYGDPAGLPALREAIARHIGVSRAVTVGADAVVVTSGAQQAFHLLARVLVAPGDVVAVEEPGYPPVRRLLAAAGARVVPVRVDADGLVVDEIPDEARLVYVTPSHQFPMGTVMSLERRVALLEWAGRRGAAVVEDDYDSEYRYAERPLDSLFGLDRNGLVSYVGTFSKTMLPGIRMGFVAAPSRVAEALSGARRLADWYGDPVPQAAMARFIDDGLFARHLRRATARYAERREAILAEITRGLAGFLRAVPSAGGLHVCAVPDGRAVDTADLAARAATLGVAVFPLGAFCAAEPAQGLLFGFGAIEASDIPDGMRLLSSAALRI